MQIRQRLQIGPREYTVRLKQSTLDIRPFCVHFYHKFRNLILSDRCATSRTVPGSIPSGVTGDFSVVPPVEPCALRSTQPLKVSTRVSPGVKAAGWFG